MAFTLITDVYKQVSFKGVTQPTSSYYRFLVDQRGKTHEMAIEKMQGMNTTLPTLKAIAPPPPAPKVEAPAPPLPTPGPPAPDKAIAIGQAAQKERLELKDTGPSQTIKTSPIGIDPTEMPQASIQTGKPLERISVAPEASLVKHQAALGKGIAAAPGQQDTGINQELIARAKKKRQQGATILRPRLSAGYLTTPGALGGVGQLLGA